MYDLSETLVAYKQCQMPSCMPAPPLNLIPLIFEKDKIIAEHIPYILSAAPKNRRRHLHLSIYLSAQQWYSFHSMQAVRMLCLTIAWLLLARPSRHHYLTRKVNLSVYRYPSFA